MSISGVRLYATAELRGTSADTVRLIVSATNTTRYHKNLHVGGACGEPGDAVHAVFSQGSREWDSSEWRQQRAAARLGGASPSCLLGVIVVTLAAGAKGNLASADLPVTAILGDSLPPGRYRVRFTFLGARASAVHPAGSTSAISPADEVELRAPAPR